MSKNLFVFLCLALAVIALVANPPKPQTANDSPTVISY